MSDVRFESDGSGTLTLAGDSNPLKKELAAALSALEKFVDSTVKSLDAFDARFASSFGKFAGTAQKAFDEFRTNAAETLKSFGLSSRGLVDELKPVEAAARDAFGAGGGTKPPKVASGSSDGDDGKPKTVDVSFASQAFNSAAISAVKSFGKSALDAFVSFGDSMDKMSQRTGFGVETLSAYSHAAGQCGTTLETVEGAIRGATTVLGQAANGSTDAAKKFDRIGLSVGDLVAMKPEEQFRAIMRGVASIENPTLRASAALEIFGDAGSQLGPMINGGADALDAYLQEAKDAGVVMSGEQAASAAALSDAIGRLKTSFKGLSLAAAETLVPAAQGFVDFASNGIEALTRFSRDFPGLTSAVETFGAAVVATFAGGYAIQRLKAYGAAFVEFAATAKNALLSLAANPVLLASAGIAAVVGGLAVSVYNAKGYVAQFSDEAAKATDAADRLRRAAETKLDVVLKAANAETLDESEFETAAKYVDELQRSYGDLGLTVDKTSKSIDAAADAQKRFSESARAEAIQNLKAELAEAERNVEEARKEERANIEQIDSWASRVVFAPRNLGNLIAPKYVDSASDVVSKQVEASGEKTLGAMKSAAEIRKRLEALERGDDGEGALYGDAEKVGGADVENAQKEVADLDAKIAKGVADAKRRRQTDLQNKIDDINAETDALEKAINARIALEKNKSDAERDASKIAELEAERDAAKVEATKRIDELETDAAEKRETERERLAEAEARLKGVEKTELEKRVDAIDKEAEAYRKLLESAKKVAKTEEERAELQAKIAAAEVATVERKNALYAETSAGAPTDGDLDDLNRRTELGALYAKKVRGEGTTDDDARIDELKTQIQEESNATAVATLESARKELDRALEALDDATLWQDAEETAKATEQYASAKKTYDEAFSALENLAKDDVDVDKNKFVSQIDDSVEQTKAKLSSSGATFSAFDVGKLGANNPFETQEKETKKTNTILGAIQDRLDRADFSARAGG